MASSELSGAQPRALGRRRTVTRGSFADRRSEHGRLAVDAPTGDCDARVHPVRLGDREVSHTRCAATAMCAVSAPSTRSHRRSAAADRARRSARRRARRSPAALRGVERRAAVVHSRHARLRVHDDVGRRRPRRRVLPALQSAGEREAPQWQGGGGGNPPPLRGSVAREGPAVHRSRVSASASKSFSPSPRHEEPCMQASVVGLVRASRSISMRVSRAWA